MPAWPSAGVQGQVPQGEEAEGTLQHRWLDAPPRRVLASALSSTTDSESLATMPIRAFPTALLLETARNHFATLNTYTETSFSGTGVHCLAYGSLPPDGRKRDGDDGHSDDTHVDLHERDCV